MRHPLSKFSAVLMHAALAAAAGLASLPGHAADGAESLTYPNIIKIRDGMGARGDLAPIARIVSPLADSQIVPGEGRIGAGSVNGTGFVLNIEVVTRDATPIAAKESLNSRNTALLGQVNPNIPGLYVFLDTDLVKPDGGVIPKNTNLGEPLQHPGHRRHAGRGRDAVAGLARA